MKLFIDIETLPTSDDGVIVALAGKVTAPANYKKAESIAEWERENKPQAVLDAVAKTSFDGMYGRICCICYAIDDGQVFSVHGDNETILLEQFYGHVSSLTTDDARGYSVDVPTTVVGHNVAGFDLPFMKHRSIILGVTPPAAILKAMNARPWDNCIADTMLMWSSDREKRASMDKLCKALGMDGKGDFDGSMVAATWPVNPQKVVDYCCADVERTRALYYRMTFDQRAKADAGVGLDVSGRAQPDTASSPPLNGLAASDMAISLDGLAGKSVRATPEELRAAVVESGDIVLEYLNSLPISETERTRLRPYIMGYVQFTAGKLL